MNNSGKLHVFKSKKPNIKIIYHTNKKINKLLLKRYITSLTKSITQETYGELFNLFINCQNDIPNLEIITNIPKLETMAVISKLFDKEEFEKFDDEFLYLKIKNIIVYYSLLQKAVYSSKINTNNEICVKYYLSFFNVTNSLVQIAGDNHLKFLLYFAYKQSILSKVKDELEKALISGE